MDRRRGIGLIIVSGNSDSENINGNLKLSRKIDKWEHKVHLAFNLSESAGEDSAESYLLDYNAKRDISKRRFLFGDARYFDDKFDSFDRIVVLSLGYGYRMFNNEKIKWTVAVGPGYRDAQFENSSANASSITACGSI
ncbi:MAG: putative salt-induced outer membrane protein [Cellvibrionaceae bacterium]